MIGAGDFTFYIKTGYLIEDGKLTRPSKTRTSSATARSASSARHGGQRLQPFDEGGWTCGKDGQSVPVESLGMPTVAEGMDFAVCLHLEDLPDARRIAEGALARALARLGSRQGPTIKTALVVESRAANSLIKDLLAPAAAASIQQGQSFWPALMESPAFSDKLSILDDPLRPRGLASRPYDREGIAARRLALIERGVPKAVYADTYYGAKAKLPITTGEPSNQIVQPGTRGLAELVRSVGDGILVTGWAGGNADPTTGEFSQGLNGHVIRRWRDRRARGRHDRDRQPAAALREPRRGGQ
jgi:predicted Zn-dependent protease